MYLSFGSFFIGLRRRRSGIVFYMYFFTSAPITVAIR